VSVAPVHLCSDYGSEVKCPAADSSLIVSSSSWSWTITVRLLLRSIEEHVTPIPVQQPMLMQKKTKKPKSQLVPPPSIASTITEGPRTEQQTPSDYQLDLVAANPTGPAAVLVKEGRLREISERLELMLVESRALRKDAELFKGNNKYAQKLSASIQKLSSNIAYEHVTFMQQASGQKDSVMLSPKDARGSTWKREISSRGGTSQRTDSRNRKRVRDLQSKMN
jgi:hypothetical protein